MLFVGTLKLLTGLIFGATLQGFCKALPSSVLGMLLLFSGIELAIAAKLHKTTSRRDQLILITTAGAELALKSGIAFVTGFVIAALLRLADIVYLSVENALPVEDDTDPDDKDGSVLLGVR
jgi:MFS superfamily sulfate permease-like transporter